MVARRCFDHRDIKQNVSTNVYLGAEVIGADGLTEYQADRLRARLATTSTNCGAVHCKIVDEKSRSCAENNTTALQIPDR